MLRGSKGKNFDQEDVAAKSNVDEGSSEDEPDSDRPQTRRGQANGCWLAHLSSHPFISPF